LQEGNRTMSTAVSNPRASALGSVANLRNALANVRATIPESASLPYLRLLKDGDWVFGKEDHALAEGEEAIFNVMSIQHGFSCWTNKAPNEGKNELLGEVMVPVMQPLPDVLALKQHPTPWKQQLAVDLKLVSGPHAGKELHFKTTAVGGVNAMRGLLDAVLAQMDVSEEYVFPIVSIGVDSYKHSSYGKTYFPVFDVVGWADTNGEEEGNPDAVETRALPPARANDAPAGRGTRQTMPVEPEPERPTPKSLREGRAARARELAEAEEVVEEVGEEPSPPEQLDPVDAPRRRRRT
jgi:hypothetical protein